MAKKAKTKKRNPHTKSTTQTKPKRSWRMSRQQKVLWGSFFILLAIGLIIAFTSFLFTWKIDQSVLGQLTDRQVEAQNWLSKFGASISDFFMYKGFGIAAFSIAILVGLTGIYMFFDLKLKKLWSYWGWGIMVMIWFSTFFGFFAKQNALIGGVIGFETNDFLQDYLGLTGTILLLFFIAIAYSVLRLKLTPEKVGAYFKQQHKQVNAEFKSAKAQVKQETVQRQTAASSAAESVTATPPSKVEETPVAPKEVHAEKEPAVTSSEFDLNPDVQADLQAEIEAADQEDKAVLEFEESFQAKNGLIDDNSETETEKIVISAKEDTEDDVDMEVETVKEEEIDEEDLSEKIVQDFGEFDPTLELSNFRFPTLELLVDHSAEGGGITINQEELEENKDNIVNTLKNYKIGIAQIKATVGPTVTLYEIVPEAGIRISKIRNLEDDIALSLAALGIRIIAPIPGRGTIGIEVPNKHPSIVSMRSVLASKKFKNAEMQLPIALGKTISNETFVVDLAKMPHLLMAGATGQGKSVGLNAILTSLLYRKHPAEIKFVLVDPKKVELTLYNKIERHYLAKLPDSEEAIITDNSRVINTLNSLCIEMDERYDLLKMAMVRNIKEYNRKFKKRKLNPNDGHRFLPYIVLVVDEFADLIMTAGKEVETPIARLAQLARAIGIHLIIATQRPSVNVITGMIKANFPARIAFRVTSKIDSRTILDSGGADQLIGRGDMLYTQGNALTRIQCAFVDTPEVDKVTEFIGSQRAYASAFMLPEYEGEESGTSVEDIAEERDKKFRAAAEVIVTAQQGSASLLQRKLKIGYNRAGRIIDQLEAAGIVGPFEGSKARKVLVTDLVSLEQFLNEES